MQANRQNTRQLASGATELMEWFTQGAEWSILNYGPGILWFSYTPGVDAAPGEVQATKLDPGFSFTDSASAPRFLQLSLTTEAGGLTYCLNTNQRYGAGSLPPGGGAGDVEEAPLDGVLYGRRSAAWQRAVDIAGDTMSGPLIVSVDPNATLALNGDRICDLMLGRGGQPRWILGCTHFAEPGYPYGLYFLRMNADGTAIQDFPFSIRRADGHVILAVTEAESVLKLGILDQPAFNELVTRFWVENANLFVRRTGDTMTGSLRLEGGGIVMRVVGGPTNEVGDAIMRLEGGEASVLEFADATTMRWFMGSAHVGADQGFSIIRGPAPTPRRDFFISQANGQVTVGAAQFNGIIYCQKAGAGSGAAPGIAFRDDTGTLGFFTYIRAANPELHFQVGASPVLTTTGDPPRLRIYQEPIEDLGIANKAYVDRLGAGPINAITAQGSGWVGNASINFQTLSGGAALQMIATLNRTPGQEIPPGAPPLILGTLPIGFRPFAGAQIQMVACSALINGGGPEAAFEYGLLMVDSLGLISFFGHAVHGTSTIYISNTFSLTMN